MNNPKVPYDNDPRPLKPANKNLREIDEGAGPNPTQDGPHRGTAAAAEDMAYLDLDDSMYDYLEHFRQKKNLEEGHNTGIAIPASSTRRVTPQAPSSRSQGPVARGARPVAGKSRY